MAHKIPGTPGITAQQRPTPLLRQTLRTTQRKLARMAGRHRTMTTEQLTQELHRAQRHTAEILATLFRIDPTPERLTAWADAYGMLGEES